MSFATPEEASNKSTYHQRYHDCQKTDIAENHYCVKAFWSRMNEEISQFGKDEAGTSINEVNLSKHMHSELPSGKVTVVSHKAVKTLSKACEMFVLELTLRACQSKLDGGNTLSEEDVLRALRTSEVHDMFMP